MSEFSYPHVAHQSHRSKFKHGNVFDLSDKSCSYVSYFFRIIFIVYRVTYPEFARTPRRRDTQKAINATVTVCVCVCGDHMLGRRLWAMRHIDRVQEVYIEIVDTYPVSLAFLFNRCGTELQPFRHTGHDCSLPIEHIQQCAKILKSTHQHQA